VDVAWGPAVVPAAGRSQMLGGAARELDAGGGALVGGTLDGSGDSGWAKELAKKPGDTSFGLHRLGDLHAQGLLSQPPSRARRVLHASCAESRRGLAWFSGPDAFSECQKLTASK